MLMNGSYTKTEQGVPEPAAATKKSEPLPLVAEQSTKSQESAADVQTGLATPPNEEIPAAEEHVAQTTSLSNEAKDNSSNDNGEKETKPDLEESQALG